MTRYEYQVIPAPKRGDRQTAAKTAEDRYALTIASIMNKMGAQGWEFQRVDALPSEERQGLTGRATVFHNLLIFRRPLDETPADVTEPPLTALPEPEPEPEEYEDLPAEDTAEYLDEPVSDTPGAPQAEPTNRD